MSLLDDLLVDKTTKQNIIWATDTYSGYGAGYGCREGITAELITGASANIIKTRARKAMEQQSERTRQHAEVFSPFWICKEMNDHADEVWTGKDWTEYVDSRRLEITCGEAPYLVSRYDVETGEAIPIPERIGLLDRKLRAVNENTQSEEEWLKWAIRAFWATYGYDYQGDNVLISRVNLLMSFEEYLWERWRRRPTSAEYRKLITVITWNLWQMDGLTGTIPYGVAEEEFQVIDWFGMFGGTAERSEENEQPRCLVHNWTGGSSVEFLALPTRGKKAMKFDFVIGNPPYQEETSQEVSKTNGQTPKKNIFHYFQMAADRIAGEATVMIYPAGRWIHRSGKGMEEFGLQQINDPRLKKIIFYPDSKDVFTGVAIADGIGVVIKERQKTTPGFEYIYSKGNDTIRVEMDNPGNDLMPLNPKDLAITEKVKAFIAKYKLDYLHSRILPRSLFGIESSFVQDNPGQAVPLESVQTLDFDKQIKLFTNDKAGKAGRAKWFVVDKGTIKNNQQYIGEWQVVVSSANAGGQKRDNQLEIIDNHSAFGRARVALASFKSQSEAQNFFNFAKTYVVRFMFLMTDEALTSLGKRVPDLLNYSSQNNIVDFSADLDAQLNQIIGFTSEEVSYIHTVVDNIR